ncbi:MAG: hypothetical protein ACF787_03540 [Rhodopirellula sp. JB053]|uniref:hypothetical protein n=1 Tax=Rhodopirellula sp. JB044 TaxID=3342844 RepID=UPI00370C1882
MNPTERSERIARFLQFIHAASVQLKQAKVSGDDPSVQRIRTAIEEHNVDDQGKPTIYQRFESTFYDDAQSLVTLWSFFDNYSPTELRDFRQLVALEIAGLTGDRHPRKVFDRSPFGIVALVVGTITIWMTFLRTYTGDDLSDLLELIRFNSIAGTLWIVGMFLVVWYILKTHRNNVQVALLSSIDRALSIYLDTTPRDTE